MGWASGTSVSAPGPASMVDADEESICPTCGQWLDAETSAPGWQPRQYPWWPWVLVIVGLYVVVVFGLRSWDSHQSLLSLERANLEGPSSEKEQLRDDATAWRLRDDLNVVAVGLLTALLGLGATARWAVARAMDDPASRLGAAQHTRQRPSPRVRTLLTVWSFAETTGVSLIRVFLVCYGFVVDSSLISGGAPSLELANDAAAQTVRAVMIGLRSV